MVHKTEARSVEPVKHRYIKTVDVFFLFEISSSIENLTQILVLI